MAGVRFDYPLLEALAAVIREGTFEAAARSLNITQSAVSQRVKLLEEKTGAVLVRRGRPCVATEYGLKLYRHIDQVHILEHDLEKSLHNLDDARAGMAATVRIAVNQDSLGTWFPEVIQRAATRLNILFDLIPDDEEHTAERLRSGEALAAVTTEPNPVHGCKRIPLGSMEFVALATPRYVEANFADGLTLESVASAVHLVFDRKDTLPRSWMLNAFGEALPLAGHWVPSVSGYLACCLNGAGWGLMPRFTVADHLRAGRLRELMPGTSVMVDLYWQSSVRGSEVMRELSGIVVDVATKHLLVERAPGEGLRARPEPARSTY